MQGVPEAALHPVEGTLAEGQPVAALGVMHGATERDAVKFDGMAAIQPGYRRAALLGGKRQIAARRADIENRLAGDRVAADILLEASPEVPGARQRLATGQIDIMVKPALALLRQRPRPLDHQRARYSDSWIGDIAHAVIAEIGRLGPAVSGTAGGGSHTSNDPCTLRPMPGAAIVSAGYGKDR